MDNNQNITVVISAYNEEEYLPKCLDALKKQTYPKDKFEIIVVDNNSTDKTVEIAKAAQATVIHEPIQGYIHALSAGMAHAKGDIIAVTDSDTIPAPNWLENIAKALAPKSVIAVTGSAHVNSHSKVSNFFSYHLYNIFVESNFLIGKPHLTGFNFAVKKEYYDRIGGININYEMSPDVELGLRMKKIGKVVFADNVSVITSTRRWKSGVFKALAEYTKGYFYTVWLRKPPPVKQTVIR